MPSTSRLEGQIIINIHENPKRALPNTTINNGSRSCDRLPLYEFAWFLSNDFSTHVSSAPFGTHPLRTPSLLFVIDPFAWWNNGIDRIQHIRAEPQF